MRRTLAHLLAAAAAWLALAGAACAQPPVWIVHGSRATLILFGSIHLLPPGLDWEPPALKQALARAHEIWFEVPLDAAGMDAAAQAAAAKGLQPTGQALSEQLPAKDWSRLAALAQFYGASAEMLDRMRPWLADVTLEVASYAKMGAVTDDGVERQLSVQLGADVVRRAFETPQQQIDALAGASPSDQIASLEETLDELQQGPALYQQLLKAWLDGDVAQIQALALTPVMTAAPGAYRALVVDRNQRWIGAVLGRLDQPGEAVMVVGVGHLIGPDGLPNLLRERGVRVDGP